MSEMMSTTNSSIKNSNKRKRVPDNTTHMLVPTTATATATATTTKNRNYENNDNTNNDLCSIDIITTKTQPVATTTTTITTTTTTTLENPSVSTSNVKRTSIRQKYQRNCNIKPNAIHITTRKSSKSLNLNNNNEEENIGEDFDLDKKTNIEIFEELQDDDKNDKELADDNKKRREIDDKFFNEEEEGNEESTNDDDDLSSNNSNSSKSNNSNNYNKYKLNVNTKQKHKRKKCVHPKEESIGIPALEAHEENLKEQIIQNNYHNHNHDLNDANAMNKTINWCDKDDKELEFKKTENKNQQVNERFFEISADNQQNFKIYEDHVDINKTESYKNQLERQQGLIPVSSPSPQLSKSSPPPPTTANLIEHFNVMVNIYKYFFKHSSSVNVE